MRMRNLASLLLLSGCGLVTLADLDPDGDGLCPEALVGVAGCDPEVWDCDNADPAVLGPQAFAVDGDGDGFGDAAATESSCELRPGLAETADDCDDADADEHPGVVWFADADGDGFGDAGRSSDCARAQDSDVLDADDCDDDDGAVNPGAAEICNEGLDDDCDDLADLDDPDLTDLPVWFEDGDGDGAGTPGTGVAACEAPETFVGNDDDACPLDNPDDSDGDTICDADDACAAGDDRVDTDSDLVPDACDACPLDAPDDTDGDGACDSADPCPLDNPDDSDGDTICDAADLCPGSDDRQDTDLDGVADCVDACPLAATGDTDGDGVCDDLDVCAGADDLADEDADGAPDACDDCPSDPFDDSDADGVCDGVDVCPGADDALDADGSGVADCLECPGADSDGDGVADACDACPSDFLDDSDADSVCDSDDLCPGSNDLVDGDLDGLPDCLDACPVDPQNDADADGVCGDQELCPGSDDALDADGDGLPDCVDACPLDPLDDADADGVCGDLDVCPGSDDTLDADADGAPDACDACSLDPLDDADADGVCGELDVCPGSDDTLDADSDGVADCLGCADSDGDSVCEAVDACPGEDDLLDTDADLLPDCLDVCPLDPDDDADADGVCGELDVCPGSDDAVDADGDGTPDGCESTTPCEGTDLLVEDFDAAAVGADLTTLGWTLYQFDAPDVRSWFVSSNLVDEGNSARAETAADCCGYHIYRRTLPAYALLEGDVLEVRGVLQVSDAFTATDSESVSLNLYSDFLGATQQYAGVSMSGVNARLSWSDLATAQSAALTQPWSTGPLEFRMTLDALGQVEGAWRVVGDAAWTAFPATAAVPFLPVELVLQSEQEGWGADSISVRVVRPDDVDDDGVCDAGDACPGADDRQDGDGDGVPDGCDPCPDDALDDADGDGLCASADPCPSDPGNDDADLDGVCAADGDCDDLDPDIFPGAPETIGDGVDQDCDGEDGCWDLDCDELPDLALDAYSDGDFAATTTVYFSPDRTGAAASVSLQLEKAFEVVALDLDRDGFQDLVFPSAGDGTSELLGAGTSYVFWGSVTGPVPAGPAELSTVGATRVCPGDFDGDGDQDLLFNGLTVGSDFEAATSTLHWNEGGRTFTRQDLPSDVDGVSECLVADVDGDGDDDAVLVSIKDDDYATTSWVMRNLGGGVLGWDGFETSGAEGADVADVDGDGKLEIVVGNNRSADGSSYAVDSRVFRGSLDYDLADSVALPTSGARVPVFGDLDEDGLTDVVFASEVGADSFVYLGLPDALDGVTWSDANRVALPTVSATEVRVVDLDQDGHLDLVFGTNVASGSARLFFGLGDGQFADSSGVVGSPDELAVDYAKKPEVADLDGDGFLDVLLPRSTDAAGDGGTVHWGSALGWSDADATSFAGNGARTMLAVGFRDADRDGYRAEEDCDDANNGVYPGRVELANGVDDDCDGVVDDAVLGCATPIDGYLDLDGDGFGDPLAPDLGCLGDVGWAETDGDCDDADPATYPGAAFNDSAVACMNDDDGDGWGDDLVAGTAAVAGTDCDDEDPVLADYCFVGGTIPLGDASVRLDGVAAGDGAGTVLASVPDLNGDGLDDLLVGAPYRDGLGRTDNGAVYVISAPASGSVASASRAILYGAATSDSAGGSVTGVRDVDGDGYGEILIGAASADVGAEVGAGAAYLVSGAVTGDVDLASAALLTLSGELAGDVAGRSVADVGDQTGDGWADLAVGANGVDGIGGSTSGAVYIVSGQARGTQSLGSPHAIIEGDAADIEFGHSVRGGGDVDGDGDEDLLVAAVSDNEGGGRAGAANLFLGPVASGTYDASAAYAKLYGENDDDYAGDQLDFAGDLNGDGLDDVVVGAWGNNSSGGANAGAAYVMYGPVAVPGGALDLSGADAKLDGGGVADIAGHWVSRVPDVDGDDQDELLVSAIQASPAGNFDGGVTYLILGSDVASGTLSGLASVMFNGEATNDYSGIALGSGDFDGDGRGDVAIGSWYDPGGLGDAGAAYLIFGRDL